jgi:hypothetical protein
MRINVDATGINIALDALDPQHGQAAMIRWYDMAIKYVKQELRARAPATLKGKVRSMTDGFTPPRWARIYVKSPLAHLIEGGTGRLGAGGFNHVGTHWPSTEGIMRATGLPKPQAFAVARSIGLRGGNPARPFIEPTYMTVKGHVEQLAEAAAAKEFGT